MYNPWRFSNSLISSVVLALETSWFLESQAMRMSMIIISSTMLFYFSLMALNLR